MKNITSVASDVMNSSIENQDTMNFSFGPALNSYTFYKPLNDNEFIQTTIQNALLQQSNDLNIFLFKQNIPQKYQQTSVEQ